MSVKILKSYNLSLGVNRYLMPKFTSPFLYSDLLYKNRQDFWDTQLTTCVLNYRVKYHLLTVFTLESIIVLVSLLVPFPEIIFLAFSTFISIF